MFLATADNSNLPSTINLNQLTFAGKINVNNVTSRINKPLTMTFSQGLGNGNFFPLLTLNPEEGSVVWQLGTFESCASGGGNDAQLTLFSGLASPQVHLFTIVVDGAPGDVVDWTEKNGTYSECILDCNSDMAITTNDLNGSLALTFPSLPKCNPKHQVSFGHVQNAGVDFIKVELSGYQPNNQLFTKFDGVVHLEAMSNGIPDLDFVPIGAPGAQSPSVDLFKRKNADGSFDIYFSSSNGTTWAPNATPQNLFFIQIVGQTNLSQGAVITCSLTSSRSVSALLNGTPFFCAFSTLDSDVVIPGFPSCPGKLKVTASQTFDTDCGLMLSFNIATAGFAPQNFSSAFIELLFILENANTVPTGFSSNLEGATTGFGSLVQVNANTWKFIYNATSPVTIESGDYIDVQFEVEAECVKYYIVRAEGIHATQSTPCAFNSAVQASNWPACVPVVSGILMRPGLNANAGRNTFMYLRSTTDPNYAPYSEIVCGGPFSFCPDQDKLPVYLQPVSAEPNEYLCGVNNWDLVLISRHNMGIENLPLPYSRVAANANEFVDLGQQQIIDGKDINAIRFCILGTTPQFGVNNSSPSWRYFKETYQFSNPSEPQHSHPYTGADKSLVPNPVVPGAYGQFTQVKMGDVDNSCVCGAKPALAEKTITVAYTQLTNGRIRADFKNFGGNALGQQWGFRFPVSDYKLVGIKGNAAYEIDDLCFGRAAEAEGIVRFLWYSRDGEEGIPAHGLLFSAEFEPLAHADIQPLQIQMTEEGMESLLYESAEAVSRATIAELAPIQPFSLLVQPNPVQDHTNVYIDALVEGNATIKVESPMGLVVFERAVNLAKGQNTFRMDLPGLVPGNYFVHVVNERAAVRRTIVKTGF